MEDSEQLQDVAESSLPIITEKLSEQSNEDASLTVIDKLKLFLTYHWRGLICLFVPLLLIPIHFSFPTEKYQWCAYTLVLMAIFWVTECIPLAVTSILPIIIFPLSGVMNTQTTSKCYINDTIIMFLGSMILAYAVEQSGLHKRLALCAIRAIGYSHYKLLFATCFITMFISMWITNTAATTMMVPINFAVLKVFEEQNLLKIYDIGPDGENVASDITTCYFCASTFSATIGGIGTLVGTATNLVFKGLFNKPKSAAAINSKITPEGIVAAKQSVDEEWKKMGRITFWEIMVVILFSSAIVLFFSRSPQIFPGWGDRLIDAFELKNKKFVLDSTVAMLVGYLMLLLPSTLDFFNHFSSKDNRHSPMSPIPSVLNWKIMNDIMPYSFMFLLGGGFALSEAAKKEYTDLNGKIGLILRSLNYLPNTVIILIIIIFTVFVTNFASNVAVCNVIAPIAMQLAKEINMNPLWYDIAVGYSASFCFILPVGTPGNLVVQSAASIPTSKMMKAGVGPTLSTIFITWVCVCFWAPIIWPDLHTLPTWIVSSDH